MSTIKSGWRRAAVFNPATGDTVQSNRISTEFSAFNHPNITSETTVGMIFAGKDIQLLIGILESDGLAQLESWMLAHTNLRAVVYGTNESVFFFEDSEVLFERGVGVNARDGVAVHQTSMSTIGSNAVAFPLVNALSKNEIWTTGADDGEIVYPIAGAQLTVAADYSGVSGSVDLVIRALDFSGSVLATVTESVSNGRRSADITLPANTYKIDIDFVSNSGSANVSNRSLRVDGSTQFVNA